MYTLLVADDEALEREALRFFVEGSGLEIDRIIDAANGSEAVKKALLEKPDIILLDINMPGLNGLEALERILVTRPDAKVIFSTAFDYFEYAVQALRLGAIDFLVKPVKKDVLLAALTKAIDQLDAEAERESSDTNAAGMLDLMSSRIVCDLANGSISDEIVYFLELAGVRSCYRGNCFHLYSPQPLSRIEQNRLLYFVRDIFSLIGVYTIALWKETALTVVAFSLDTTDADGSTDGMAEVLAKGMAKNYRNIRIGSGVGFRDLAGIGDCIRSASGLEPEVPEAPAADGVLPEEIKRACSFMDTSFAKKIGLEDIADAAGLSKYYLCRLFKQHMDTTVLDYLTRIRLDKARAFLQDGSYSIKQISLMVGYADPNYFTWAFKKAEGLSPLQYRYAKKEKKP